VWQAADALGFRAAFTFDHLVPLNPGARPGHEGGVPSGPQLEGWVTLAALAEATQRLEVGTLCSGVTYRHPVVLAKMAVSLDHVSDGRAILGLGAAWHEAEHRMYGIPFPPVGDRMTMLDETLAAFAALCQSDGQVDFDGSAVHLAGAVFDPKPVRPGGRIPVLVGGSGPRLMRLAARHADLYNGFWAPWEWGEVNDRLDGLVDGAGRKPAELERTAFVFSELSGDPARTAELVAHFQRTRGGTEEEVRSRIVAGDPDTMATVLGTFADAGVQHVIINLRPPLDVDAVIGFGERVLPAVRG
jgi:alkanesulfonate monooxygenase SsuD/methylene tetrahydromethanopterin reductase-like flavin-dependent oxidoreductase (luciferase family)